LTSQKNAKIAGLFKGKQNRRDFSIQICQMSKTLNRTLQRVFSMKLDKSEMKTSISVFLNDLTLQFKLLAVDKASMPRL